jgi:hypothetical protein
VTLNVRLVDNRDIIITNQEGLSVTYRKEGKAPMLVAIKGIGRRDPDSSELKFWAQAWKAAHKEARAVGWLSS